MAASDRLTPRQRRAAALLAAGLPAVAVAERVGVSERSVRRWTKLPAFTAEVRRLEHEALEAHVRRLQGLLGAACAALERALAAEDLRLAVRAAEVAFGAALRWTETAALAARVEALEARLGSGAPAGAPAVGGDGS